MQNYHQTRSNSWGIENTSHPFSAALAHDPGCKTSREYRPIWDLCLSPSLSLISDKKQWKKDNKTKTIQVNLPTKPSTKHKQSKPFMLTKWINSLDDGCFASQLGLLLANGTMPVRPHWAPLHHVNQRHRHHDPATHDRLQHLPDVQLRSMAWCPAAGVGLLPGHGLP